MSLYSLLAIFVDRGNSVNERRGKLSKQMKAHYWAMIAIAQAQSYFLYHITGVIVQLDITIDQGFILWEPGSVEL